MTLPNFFIVGAAKSGTTSLARYLGQHPSVFMSTPKEPNYFALSDWTGPAIGPAEPGVIESVMYNYSIKHFHEYVELFQQSGAAHIIGEASVRYLYFSHCAEKISEQIPNAKILIILRNPVDRLYSHYNMNRQLVLEPLGLMDAIREEERRKSLGWGWDWHYTSLGMYSEQIAKYLKFFSKENVKVLFYDDLVDQPILIYQEICEFLNISSTYTPDMSSRGMVSSYPRYIALAKFLYWPNKFRDLLVRFGPIGRSIIKFMHGVNAAPIPPISRQNRDFLKNEFAGDISALEALIGRPVPLHWKP